MRFLYKIWSGYDGFTPSQIPRRLADGKVLSLGWARYIESVEEGDEVWVYFHGRAVQASGVYVTGFVQAVDTDSGRVDLRVRTFSVDAPLTNKSTTARIAGLVGARGLQVFVYPEAWDTPPDCNVSLSAASCHSRQCESCPAWKSLPLIDGAAVNKPKRFPDNAAGFSPAYWVIPARCYLHFQRRDITKGVARTSELFYRFKAGESNLAYPLALAARGGSH